LIVGYGGDCLVLCPPLASIAAALVEWRNSSDPGTCIDPNLPLPVDDLALVEIPFFMHWALKVFFPHGKLVVGLSNTF
jgi:hypothetical protein